MPAIKREENTRFMGESFQTKKGYIVIDSFTAPAAPSATSMIASITTAVVTTTGLTQPDVARVCRIASGGSSHNATGNVVITGKDKRGATVTDTITLNGNTAVDGVVAMTSVTSVDTTGVSGIGANATVTVGYGAALGLSRKLPGGVADSGILGTSNGVYEGTRPTFTADSTIGKTTVTFNTASNGSRNFKAIYVSDELYASAG